MYVCTVCMYVCMYVRTYVRTYVCICACIRIYVCILFTCVCIITSGATSYNKDSSYGHQIWYTWWTLEAPLLAIIFGPNSWVTDQSRRPRNWAAWFDLPEYMATYFIYFNACSLILWIQLIVADNNRCRRLETRQTQDSMSRSVRLHLMLSILTSIQHKNLSRNTPMSDERTMMHYRADLHSTDIAADAVAPPSTEYIAN